MATMTAAAAVKSSSNPYADAARAKKVAALVALLNRRVAYDKVPVTRGSVLGLPGWARRIAEREAGVNVSSNDTWSDVADCFPSEAPSPAPLAPKPAPLTPKPAAPALRIFWCSWCDALSYQTDRCDNGCA